MTGSVDVVSDLFKMSNELRVERESIMLRNIQGGAGNAGMNAFLNREATMKYNEELDDVTTVWHQLRLSHALFFFILIDVIDHTKLIIY